MKEPSPFNLLEKSDSYLNYMIFHRTEKAVFKNSKSETFVERQILEALKRNAHIHEYLMTKHNLHYLNIYAYIINLPAQWVQWCSTALTQRGVFYMVKKVLEYMPEQEDNRLIKIKRIEYKPMEFSDEFLNNFTNEYFNEIRCRNAIRAKKNIIVNSPNIQKMTIKREEEIATEAKRRLDIWLNNSSFEEMSVNGSFLRFDMSLGLFRGYPFPKPKWMHNKGFKGFVTEDEFYSSQYDSIIKKLFKLHCK